MTSSQDRRFQEFLDAFRKESQQAPSRGLKRFARFARGGASLAKNVVFAKRRGRDAVLTDRDLDAIEALVSRLGELKGLPMKLGQIMSYLELDMPEQGRQLLALLQTQSPATPFERVAAVVHEDLGSRSEELLSHMEPAPFSVASIGQVHRATLPDKTQVAVKVRHPDIETAIRSDFRVAQTGTGLGSVILPGIGATARDFIGELEARLLEECDYELEAERQRLFRSLYAKHPVVVVPEVYTEWSGPRVLTSTWEAGSDFETFRKEAKQSERDRAGAALFDFYIGTLYRHGVFHADPHPGNYCFRNDGRIVVFDYGCVRVFEPDVARAFVAMADAVRADDRSSVCDALRGLGAELSNDDKSYAHVRRLLRSFFRPMLNSGPQAIEGRIVVDMGKIARDKLALARLRLPGRLMFLFRIRFGLYAVLSRLGAICDWSLMEHRFAEEARSAGGGGRPDPPT